ncbi:hypothetical protein JM79_3197 [Gramella sp. Hel_I_59]|uniref:helix-turn-helix transcriptional regulator n=1 Tax=Gramella sp. Hel_I_59 TaxID=1249978 RepID=UPI00114EF999|nr:hypothetical protein [Gramella sp. Hel_I_59]TQI72241.1 hypothetical protein JM79_3197 [Gramella sp. Hel_I_59]
MNYETTTTTANSQELIAGLLKTDSNIEFFCVGNLKTHWIQNGKTHTWKDLPVPLFAACMTHFNKNEKARTALENYKENGEKVSRNRQVEIYIALGWGSADGHPDMIDGILQPMENYRHKRDCISLRFKSLIIDGKPLKPREVFMLDEMGQDADPLDETIAVAMSIKRSTYNSHSRELRDKAGVSSKHALLMKATRQGVVREFNNF